MAVRGAATGRGGVTPPLAVSGAGTTCLSGGKPSYSWRNGRPRIVREGREQAFARGS